MLKHLLVALDPAPAGRSAEAFAIALAASQKATLQGLAVVDINVVVPFEPVPIGGEAYKAHKDALFLERAQTAAGTLAAKFKADGQAAGVAVEAQIVQGPGLASLIGACAAHDAIVIGHDATFGADAKVPSPVIAGLLRDNPRPLFVTPALSVLAPGAPTLVAYDGSVPAMRALQLFAALGLGLDREVVVVSVAGDGGGAKVLADAGASFIKDRGYRSVAHPISGGNNPVAVLVEAAKEVGAGLIVAGAYGHRGWREWLLGTTTESLIAKSPVPLFIHH